VNVELSVAHLERRLVVAPPLADLAGDVHIGKEVHLYAPDAVAFTALATSPAMLKEKRPGW